MSDLKQWQVWKTTGPLHHQALILELKDGHVKFSESEETDHGTWCGKDTLPVAEFLEKFPTRYVHPLDVGKFD